MEMELEYYYLCSREIEHKIDRTIRGTMMPHLKIKFNVWSRFEDVKYEDSEQDEDTPISAVIEDYSGSAYVTSGDVKSLTYEEVGEAVGKAISDAHYSKYDRESIIELMAREVRDMIMFSGAGELNLKHTVWTLDMEIRMKRRWRYHVVDKYEMQRFREEAGCCCICLEEFGCVREGMRMPCSHVFHDGCIKEWRRASTRQGYNKEWSGEVEAKERRRTSHYYCPICRCELPLDTFIG